MSAGSLFLFCATVLVFLAPDLLASPLVVVLALQALASAALSRAVLSPARARRFLFALALGGALLLRVSLIGPRQAPALPFPTAAVRRLDGRLSGDSGSGAGGGAVLDLRIESCLAADGTWATARGLARVFAREPRALAAGTVISAKGRFERTGAGLVFKAASLEVREPPPLASAMRLKLAERAVSRLEAPGAGSALAIMLVLGRSAEGRGAREEGEEIRALAKGCGCLHVLALSGLHLGFFSSLSRRLLFFARGRLPSLVLGLLLSVAFVLFIGPRSSLLRAALCLGIGLADRLLGLRLEDMEKLALAALIQFSFFPDSLSGAGTAFSYTATAGLLFLGLPLGRLLASVLPRRAASALGAGAGALCLSSVLSLRIEGVWRPGALVAGPLACPVVFLAMGVGFARLVWPNSPVLRKAGSLLDRLLRRVFGFRLSSGPWGLALFFLCLLTAGGAILYARKRSGRRAERDDLELQLRFAPGAQVPS